MWTTRTYILAAVMLITGTINTVATKMQDMTVVGRDGSGRARTFDHPFFQTACMFAGETLCLIPYYVAGRFRHRRVKRRVQAALLRDVERYGSRGAFALGSAEGAGAHGAARAVFVPDRGVAADAEGAELGEGQAEAAPADLLLSESERSQLISDGSRFLNVPDTPATPLTPATPAFPSTPSAADIARARRHARGVARAERAARAARHLAAALAFALPALFDAGASTALNLGLELTTASAYQMLRGTLVVFAALLTVVILRRRLHAHHWIGVVLIASGAAIVGVASAVGGGGGKHRKGGKGGAPSGAPFPALGNAIVVGAQALAAAQFVIEERFLSRYRAPVLLAVGAEGTWGLALSCLVLLPLANFIPRPSVDGSGASVPLDSLTGALAEVAASPRLQVTTAVTIASIAAFNTCGVSVTKELSGAARAAVDATRTLLVWGAGVWAGWETATPLQAVGFAVLLTGTSVYNELLRSLLPKSERDGVLGASRRSHRHRSRHAREEGADGDLERPLLDDGADGAKGPEADGHAAAAARAVSATPGRPSPGRPSHARPGSLPRAIGTPPRSSLRGSHPLRQTPPGGMSVSFEGDRVVPPRSRLGVSLGAGAGEVGAGAAPGPTGPRPAGSGEAPAGPGRGADGAAATAADSGADGGGPGEPGGPAGSGRGPPAAPTPGARPPAAPRPAATSRRFSGAAPGASSRTARRSRAARTPDQFSSSLDDDESYTMARSVTLLPAALSPRSLASGSLSGNLGRVIADSDALGVSDTESDGSSSESDAGRGASPTDDLVEGGGI